MKFLDYKIFYKRLIKRILLIFNFEQFSLDSEKESSLHVLNECKRLTILFMEATNECSYLKEKMHRLDLK